MEHSAFDTILTLLITAVITISFCRLLKLPNIIGYLIVGVLVGPYGFGWIADNSETRFLAEFGVVFLLFTIGLEFSLARLLAMRKTVLVLGSLQVVSTLLITGLICKLLGLNNDTAFVIGGIMAMSSTAIVIRQLSEQLELHSRHGRQAVGILLFQDLAVIPLLILIPALADTDQHVSELLFWALGKGIIVLIVMLSIGHWLLRPIFHAAAKARSPDLFMLTVLLFSLTAAWLTHAAGLSLALGAFLAGMMIGETEFRHQVEADIRPFRDVLLGLFFITIGMLLNIHTLPDIWLPVLGITMLIIFGKTALIMGLAILHKTEHGVALRTGLSLAQGGEFGFILLSLAISTQLLTGSIGQIILAAILLSMGIAPIIIRYNGHIAKRIFSMSYNTGRANIKGEISRDAEALKEHVIICGYGRVGQNIARFLEKENFDYIAIDLDPVRVREARQAGESVSYGDSTHMDILESAGLDRAVAILISFDETRATLKILENTRNRRPDMPILVRTRDDTDLELLQEAGATEVVPESLEASLMLMSHLLMLLGIPVSAVVRHVRDVRADRYSMLRGFFHGEEAVSLEEPESHRKHLHSIVLNENAWALGHTLQELELEKTGVMVTAIRRGGIRGPEPEPHTKLIADDVLILYGTQEETEHAENKLFTGSK